MIITQATHKSQLKGILELQEANLRENLDESTRNTEGFLTVSHSLELLEEMNRKIRHIIAIDHDKVVGYALAMSGEMRDRLPVLEPMFQKIDTISFRGKPLKESNYYVMGQICIAREYRGAGLFSGLYEKHRECYANNHHYLITEVSGHNQRSLRAHEKQGFQTILKYRDETDHWHLILWDWTQPDTII